MAEEKEKMRAFDADSLKATCMSWERQIEKNQGDLIPIQYQRVLSWVKDNADYDASRENFAYGIFSDDKKVASAVVDVIYSKSGRKWLKLLDVHLAPEIDLSFSSEKPDMKRIVDIFGAAILGVVRLTERHPTKVTKLYGRSSSLLSFLKRFGAYLNDHGPSDDIGVSIEGRWLVIRVK